MHRAFGLTRFFLKMLCYIKNKTYFCNLKERQKTDLLIHKKEKPCLILQKK